MWTFISIHLYGIKVKTKLYVQKAARSLFLVHTGTVELNDER